MGAKRKIGKLFIPLSKYIFTFGTLLIIICGIFLVLVEIFRIKYTRHYIAARLLLLIFFLNCIIPINKRNIAKSFERILLSIKQAK